MPIYDELYGDGSFVQRCYSQRWLRFYPKENKRRLHCSKWPFTGTYPQPDESHPHRHALFGISLNVPYAIYACVSINVCPTNFSMSCYVTWPTLFVTILKSIIVPIHDSKVYRGVDVQLHLFLMSELE